MTASTVTYIDSMGEWKRTHDCGSLRAGDTGMEVILMGWVNSRRDLGNLIFVDLRDRWGITQVVFDPNIDSQCHERARVLRNEWVIAVKGKVSIRVDGQENPGLPTGQIELKATELRILNRTDTPPFQVDGAVDASETIRLKYRYLELRRPDVFSLFFKRHCITSRIRTYLNEKGFMEVETPVLTKSTPEGARDYLVPSRINRGMFYALPQSPQLFKQLLMIGGFDRYYQIVKCFRDEDLRADRQPEFTQVDVEMSFVDEDDVMHVFEGMMQELFSCLLDYDIPVPIPRISYHDAMERFGTDRPDMRFGMEFNDISDIARRSSFKIFKGIVDSKGKVKAIRVDGGAQVFSRKKLDALSELAVANGAKGISWIKVTDKGWQSSLNRFFSGEDRAAIDRQLGVKQGDLIIMVADMPDVVNTVLGVIRLDVAGTMDLIRKSGYAFVWVTDFPMFEYNDTEERFEAIHHPFTSPVDDDIPLLLSNPAGVRARAYDLVINGTEIGGGSIRIHNADVQEKVLSILGISDKKARQKFGFLLEALKYGAPPHGGMAIGLDRLVAMILGVDSIREVIAFPKTTSAACLLTEAPSFVEEEQLKELGLKLIV